MRIVNSKHCASKITSLFHYFKLPGGCATSILPTKVNPLKSSSHKKCSFLTEKDVDFGVVGVAKSN